MKEINLQEKMTIKSMLESGKKYPTIASCLNLNLKTVEKWGLIIKKGGDLNPLMGRPRQGKLYNFDDTIKSQIDTYRPNRTGWGAITIQVELAVDENHTGKKIPSVSSINKYLKEKQRTLPRHKQFQLPIASIYPATYAHELWQLDAEGNSYVEGVGHISFINIKDVYSKATIQIYPCPLKSKFNHPTTIDYQTVLRLSMMRFGRCKQLQVDHESIYFDNVNSSPFPTKFHLWLIGLGIEMCLTPKGRPQKQGMVERSHQTIHRQVVPAHQQFTDWQNLFDYANFRCDRLNNLIPNRMLGGKAPFMMYPDAKQSKLLYHPIEEKELFDIMAVRKYLSAIKWYRQVASNKTISLDNNVYYIKQAVPKEELMITYNMENDCFVFQNAKGVTISEKPVKGLNFKELASNLEQFIQLFVKQPET